MIRALLALVPGHCLHVLCAFFVPMFFFKFMYQIAIQFQIKDTLLQKFLRTDLICFDQIIVSTVKFGECFLVKFYNVCVCLQMDITVYILVSNDKAPPAKMTFNGITFYFCNCV